MTFPVVLGFVSGSAVTAAVFLSVGFARFYQVCAVMVRTARAHQPFAGLRLTDRDGKVVTEVPLGDPRLPFVWSILSGALPRIGSFMRDHHRTPAAAGKGSR